jgi:hypothetical protein
LICDLNLIDDIKLTLNNENKINIPNNICSNKMYNKYLDILNFFFFLNKNILWMNYEYILDENIVFHIKIIYSDISRYREFYKDDINKFIEF